MREIKFRAWDKTARTFYFVSLLGDGWTHQPTDLEGHELSEWQQYTGLKDKNGAEIWEGDIVKKGDGLNYEVRWSGAAFGFRNVMWNYRCEVIGNIYENPELLEANQ